MSRSEMVIEIELWIDAARDRIPYDAELVKDLWYMRDVIDGVAEHRKLKGRLIDRIANFDQTESILYLKDLLEKHYA